MNFNTKEKIMSKTRKHLIALTCLLAAAGCASPGERQAQVQAEVEQIVARCDSMGYYRDTPAGRQCAYQMIQADYQSQRASTEAWQRSLPSTTTCRPDGLGGARCTTR